MNMTAAEWSESLNNEGFDEILGDILFSQGYFVSIFNNLGERLNGDWGGKDEKFACADNMQGSDFCKEHYAVARRALGGSIMNTNFCQNFKDRILICSPLKTSSDRELGVVVACRKGGIVDSNYRDRESKFLKGISVLLAEKIYQDMEIKKLTEELNTKYEEITLLYEIGDKTQVTDEVDKTIEYIVRRAMEVINSSLIVWTIPGEGKNRFYINPERDLKKNDIDKEKLEKVCRIVMRMLNRIKTPLVLNNLSKYKEFVGVLPSSVNLLSIPLMGSRKGFGALNFFEYDTERIFVNDHLKVMESIARSTVNILKNSELYMKLQKLFFNVIRMLLGIIESKDSYTEGHSKRVYKISIELAKLLGLSRKDVYDLEWAGILHDIGKITVPENILKKPGKLTSEEFEAIKSHPGKGAELVSTIEEFKNAIKGIKHHHERIDGKGYPDGLKGNEIPLIARIIAIADTFDALNSTRPYRPKPPQEFVLKEIKESSGTQLDATLVGLFLKNYELFLKLIDDKAYELFEDTDIKGLW